MEATPPEENQHEAVPTISPRQLFEILSGKGPHATLIIDTRKNNMYLRDHIHTALSLPCDRKLKGKYFNLVTVEDKLVFRNRVLFQMRDTFPIVIYDDEKESEEMHQFVDLLLKDRKKPRSISILSGGFPAFHKEFPTLCTSYKKIQEIKNKGKKGPVAKNSKKPKQLKSECLTEEQDSFEPIDSPKDTDPKLDVAQILDFLFLGNRKISEDGERLKQHGITHIVNAASKECENCFPNELVYHGIPLDDVAVASITPHFKETFDFIEKMRKEAPKSRILIHCVMGRSRSASLVIAYLMKYQNMKLKEALMLLRSKKSDVSPNPGFLSELQRFEIELYNENSWNVLQHSFRKEIEWMSKQLSQVKL